MSEVFHTLTLGNVGEELLLQHPLDFFSFSVKGVKAFRVSSLSSAAEQRRLFAMHFVLRSSGNSSRWKRKTVTDRRKK